MIRRIFSTVLAIAFIYSCTSPKKEEKEILLPGYEMKTFRLESEGGCASDTSSCALYEITYPVFSNLPTPVLDSIAKAINKAMEAGDAELTGLSFDSLGKEFIRDFEQFNKEFQDSPMGWHFEGAVDVDSMSNTILCMTASTNYFTGGAHDGYGTYFINLDPATGKRVTLTDKFKPGFEEPLRQAGEKIFKESYEADSLSESGMAYEFEDGMFTLNDNYSFTREGIRFFYNIYEIGPYAAGVQEIVIPYEDIEALRR